MQYLQFVSVVNKSHGLMICVLCGANFTVGLGGCVDDNRRVERHRNATASSILCLEEAHKGLLKCGLFQLKEINVFGLKKKGKSLRLINPVCEYQPGRLQSSVC